MNNTIEIGEDFSPILVAHALTNSYKEVNGKLVNRFTLDDIEEIARLLLEYAKEKREDGKEMTIADIRKITGLKQAEFAEKYGIPIRTLMSWEQEIRKPAPYIVTLLEKAVKSDYR